MVGIFPFWYVDGAEACKVEFNGRILAEIIDVGDRLPFFSNVFSSEEKANVIALAHSGECHM